MKQRKKFLINWYSNSVYKSYWLNKFINRLFFKGKKEYIERHLYSCFSFLKGMSNYPLLIFYEILDMVKPIILLKWIRKGKNYYQVPKLIHRTDSYKTAILWISYVVKKNNSLGFFKKIFVEFVGILCFNDSKLFTIKRNLYSVGLTNRTFVNYIW